MIEKIPGSEHEQSNAQETSLGAPFESAEPGREEENLEHTGIIPAEDIERVRRQAAEIATPAGAEARAPEPRPEREASDKTSYFSPETIKKAIAEAERRKKEEGGVWKKIVRLFGGA